MKLTYEEECGVCGHKFEVDVDLPGSPECLDLQTPVSMSPPDLVCAGCRRTLLGTCPLQCLSCRKIRGRIMPHKTPSGFVFVPNVVYHIDTCPVCSKGECKSSIMELFRFNLEHSPKSTS